MKILQLAVVAAILLNLVSASSSGDHQESWSWNSQTKTDDNEPVKIQKRSDEVIDDIVSGSDNQTLVSEESQGRHLVYADQEILSNETDVVDDVIDTILHGTRDGRGLENGDYDQVYSDPNVQEALAKGDDVQARNLIKEKLCSLGLMNCDGSGDAEGKRPFYSNIYAQQGRPQNGVRRPGPPYGPARPMPPPGKYYGPPRKVGYEGGGVPSGYGGKPSYIGGNRPPSYHGPYLEHPPSAQDNSLTFGKPPAGSIIYGSKPPGPVYTGGDAPYNFEHIVGEKIHVEDHHSGSAAYPGHAAPFTAGVDSFGLNSGSFGGGSNSGSFGGVGSGSFGSHTGSSYAQNSISSYVPSAGAAHLSGPALIAAGSVGHSPLDTVPAASTAPLQQHVHHHFHHVEDSAAAAKPTIVTVPVPVPVPSGNGLSSQFSTGKFETSSGFAPISSGYGSSNTASGYDFNKQAQATAAFNAGFNGASQGGLLSGATTGASGFGGVNSGQRPIGSLYNTGVGIKPVSEGGLSNYGSSNYAQSSSGIYGNPAGGSFHSTNPNYFKKELQTGIPQYSNLNTFVQQNKYQSSGGATNQYTNQNQGNTDDYQGFETSRQQNVDCTCIPINQCPAADRIGRKDDLILPLDPRNLATDIEAINDTTTTINTRSSSSTVDDTTTISHKVKREAKAESKQADDIDDDDQSDAQARQSYFGGRPSNNNVGFKQCRQHEVCCRSPYRPPFQQQQQQLGRCGTRNAHGITGRIKNPVYVDGDSEYGEYPWQVAILKKDPKESVYVCGGTIIDQQHIITAAHCVKTYQGFDLRVRLGEWDVNHDVEFYPYIERDVISVTIHPEYYAGTLDNDLAVLRLDQPIDYTKTPHISPACLPDKFSDYTGARCWTTGWGKDAFGDFGKYQNILKEVDVPIIEQQQCQNQLRNTRLGYNYKLNPGFICAGGEEGKDACKGDGGGPMVCERNGIWQLVGVVSWGIGCGQVNVPGVYVRVSYYLDWIHQVTRY